MFSQFIIFLDYFRSKYVKMVKCENAIYPNKYVKIIVNDGQYFCQAIYFQI